MDGVQGLPGNQPATTERTTHHQNRVHTYPSETTVHRFRWRSPARHAERSEESRRVLQNELLRVAQHDTERPLRISWTHPGDSTDLPEHWCCVIVLLQLVAIMNVGDRVDARAVVL